VHLVGVSRALRFLARGLVPALLGFVAAGSPSSATADPAAVPSLRGAAPDGTHTVGGLRYFEFVTGGAHEDDALPMIVLLHGMSNRPRMFTPVVMRFPQSARFIVPFGFLPSGLGFAWMEPRTATLGPGAQLDAELPKVVEQVSSALVAIRAARPTVGKVVLGGFSQGAEVSYGLALLHPEMFVRVCPMAGALTNGLLNRQRPSVATPEVHGFQGADDPIIRPAAGQLTIAGFTRLGYAADIKLYPGVGHDFTPAIDDVSACLQAGARAAAATP
jgi:phospholipase/carboxylesterase